MILRRGFGSVVIFSFLLVLSNCENPSETNDDQNTGVYWPDLNFEPLNHAYNRCTIQVFDTVYSNYQYWEDTTNLVNLYSSLGDHEKLFLVYEFNIWSREIRTLQTQTYQEMDNIFQVSPKDQEGWVLINYYSRFSNQFCSWRLVWEVE